MNSVYTPLYDYIDVDVDIVYLRFLFYHQLLFFYKFLFFYYMRNSDKAFQKG
jgi:hypothetical protein